MSKIDQDQVVSVLNRLLEAELAGVVRYTHYSFLVFGFGRIPIVSWLREQANESLSHAQQIGEWITALGAYPSLEIGPLLDSHKHDITAMLRESLETERSALELYRELLGLVAGNFVALEDVIAPSGYRPEQVRAVTDVLGGAIAHYVFISSISAYREFPPRCPFDEDAPLAEGARGYGELKARCEDALDEALPGRVARVRPGLIVGPHDPTDRFTYWPRRVARGGKVLAPGRPKRPVQIVDVRDLAEWCVWLAEDSCVGVFNAVGPASPLTMGSVLEECAAVTESPARLTWVPDDDLLAAGVKP